MYTEGHPLVHCLSVCASFWVVTYYLIPRDSVALGEPFKTNVEHHLIDAVGRHDQNFLSQTTFGGKLCMLNPKKALGGLLYNMTK